LLNTGGQTIFSKSIAHPGGTCNDAVNLPAGIASGAYQLEIIRPDKERQVQTLLINIK
jgi:hypothetical protein